MAWRHDPRVVSHGVTATIAQVPDATFTVLDISEGGMLLGAGELPLAPGAEVDFALAGELHGTGAGHVIHLPDGAAGLAVRRWDGKLGEAVREMIEKGLLANSTWHELYLDPPVRPRPPLVTR